MAYKEVTINDNDQIVLSIPLHQRMMFLLCLMNGVLYHPNYNDFSDELKRTFSNVMNEIEVTLPTCEGE